MSVRDSCDRSCGGRQWPRVVAEGSGQWGVGSGEWANGYDRQVWQAAKRGALTDGHAGGCGWVRAGAGGCGWVRAGAGDSCLGHW
jgi:hypothetical protein